MKKFLLLAMAIVFTAMWTAPSFALTPEFYGTYRVRMFAVENDVDFDDDNSDTDSWIDQRCRLMVDAKTSDQLRGFIQLEVGDTDGGRSNVFGTSGGEFNNNLRVSARQAYLSFNIGDVRLKAGRQVFGDAPDGGQSFRVADDKVYYGLYDGGLILVSALDAFVATYKIDAVTLYAIYGKLAERSGTGTRATSTSDEDNDIYGLQAWYKQDTWDAGLYFIYNRDYSNASVENEPYWIGGAVSAKFDPVTIKSHLIHQGGSYDTSTADYDYEAWAFDLDVSAKLDALTIGMALGTGSGDEDGSDTDIENFSSVAGMGRTSATNNTPATANGSGAYGVQLGGRPTIFLDNGEVAGGGTKLVGSQISVINGSGNGLNRGTLGNITFVELYGSYKATNTLTLTGLLADFWLTEEEGRADDQLGLELDLTMTYKLYPQLSLFGQAAWFFPDDGWYTKGTDEDVRNDDIVSEYLVRVQYEF